MATGSTEFPTLTVLVGPTCPTCETDDLSWEARGHDRCPDCGTEYRRYVDPGEGDDPRPTCPGCGVDHDPSDAGTAYCEDCGPSDCAFCGVTTLRWLLSENLACRVCEGEEDEDEEEAA